MTVPAFDAQRVARDDEGARSSRVMRVIDTPRRGWLFKKMSQVVVAGEQLELRKRRVDSELPLIVANFTQQTAAIAKRVRRALGDHPFQQRITDLILELRK